MIGARRLDHLQRCVETVLDDAIPGDLIEAGVRRGGAAIVMRAILAADQVTDRTVWLADSFAGVPVPIRVAILPTPATSCTGIQSWRSA